MNNGKICVSVCAETADELIEQIKRAEDLADVIEIRFDCLSESELDLALDEVSALNNKKSLLATFRPKTNWAEFFYGKIFDEETAKRKYDAFRERIASWNKVLSLKNIESLDFEDDLYFGLMMSDIFEGNILQKYKIICSHHNFAEVSKELTQTFKDLLSVEELATEESEIKFDSIKIAVHADDIADSIAVWKLLERAKEENKQIIPIAMGESGKWTRILGLAHGAFMTYAALDAGQETAPGQVSAKDLIEVYRVKNLDEQTEVYGILGSNTSVSMSPYMHNAAFGFHDLNAVFVPLQVNDLDAFIRRMVKPETREVELNFRGFSVTIPHKQSIIKHLDFLDETAEKIGAVNTVKILDGKLHGYNTDAKGFIEPLLNSYGDLKDAKVAVLGAGGAARACVYALKTAGANVTIFARNTQKASGLADDFQVELKALSTQHSALSTYEDFDVLVNTTPLGMKGKAEDETPALGEQFKNIKLVYDLVYNPFQTLLMQEADKFDVPKIGGLAMLIAQAMEQQKIWTGKDAPLKEMSRAVLKRLQ